MWFFRRESLWGYDASAVDDLLARVASERTPLGQQARWSRTRGGRGYDIDAVDLFLGQLFSHPGPGRDLGDVAQLSRTAPADLTDSSAGLARRRRRADATRGEDYFADECWNAWRDFGHQTCTRLWAERAGWRRELRTAEQQTLASLRGFTWQNRGYGQGLGCQRCRAELYCHERKPPDEEPAVLRPSQTPPARTWRIWAGCGASR